MRTTRILGVLLTLFFLLMVGATAYSITYEQRNLPLVEIGIAKKEEGKGYRIPLSALYEDEYKQKCVFIVKEQQGAWQKEYICKHYLVSLSKSEGESATVYSDKLESYPIVIKSNQPLNDGSRVRLS